MGYKQIKFEKNTVFLVTGGAGFIGSNICQALLEMGCTVRCLDNLSTGKQAHVDLFANNPNYSFIKGDIRDLSTCQDACKGVDYVLNQAALGSVPWSIEQPDLFHDVNVTGTLNMLQAARDNKVKKFVYASSSAVYGDEPTQPAVEGIEGNLLSPYAVNKSMDEQYAKLYTTLYGLPTYGLRYFNVFGRRQDPDGAYAAVVPKFIKLILNQTKPQIYGDGNQSRDFTYVENVVEANLKACLAPLEVAGQAFNVAYGCSISLNEMYAILKSLLGTNLDPVYLPERAGDIKYSSANIDKSKTQLEYDPDWSFELGIQQAIAWYKENL